MNNLKDIARKMNAIYGSTGRLPELPTLQEEWFKDEGIFERNIDFKRVFYLTGKALRGGMMDHDEWKELVDRMDRLVRVMKTW